MREPSDIAAEHALLTTDFGRAFLAEVELVREPGPARIEAWRRRASGEVVSAALRLAACRRKGHEKFARAADMWLDPVGLEQSTAEPVARHKALRFREEAAVVDLCSGLGGDALAIAGAGPLVLAVDRDPGMARRLRWNTAVYGVAERVSPVVAEAARFAIPSRAALHVDPDRRSSGTRRIHHIEDYVPSLDVLMPLMDQSPGGAVKVSPAADFRAVFPADRLEFELISLHGECKEATVWFGRLAAAGTHRATALPAGESWSSRDFAAAYAGIAERPGRFLFDPDPALLRAGLLDGFAAAHGLRRLTAGIEYLTADHPVESAFLRAYTVLEVHPFDRKTLRRRIAELGVGRLDVKVRGLGVWPQTLHRELKPRGPLYRTLILAGPPGAATAILAARTDMPDDGT